MSKLTKAFLLAVALLGAGLVGSKTAEAGYGYGGCYPPPHCGPYGCYRPPCRPWTPPHCGPYGCYRPYGCNW